MSHVPSPLSPLPPSHPAEPSVPPSGSTGPMVPPHLRGAAGAGSGVAGGVPAAAAPRTMFTPPVAVPVVPLKPMVPVSPVIPVAPVVPARGEPGPKPGARSGGGEARPARVEDRDAGAEARREHVEARSESPAAGDAEPTDDREAAPAAGGTAADGLPDDLFEQVTFADLGLRGSVLKSIEAAGFKRPTKIQAMLIPVMLKGTDVLGQARTGTGKTAAFGLPLLDRCEKGVASQALVLVPTRELCVQVADEINELGRLTPIRALAVFGGERMKKQIDGLARKPEIVVSTPGRLMDMVERGYVRLDAVRFAVLDEVDRMLDIGFRDDIRRILGMCPPPGQRQTVFVSATLSNDIERLARSHAKDAEKVVAVYTGALTNANVRQFYLGVQPWDKRKLLLHLLTHEEPALTVIFCRMKRTVDEVAEFLQKKGIDVHAIHGDMAQNKRSRTIEKLHKGDLAVLVASDLASRGIDVEGITHVINYDMPEDPEVYVHRIGRTARVGRDGVAWSFVTPEQGELLTNVENLINAEVPKLDYPDFVPSEPPPGRGPRPRPAGPTYNRYAASANPALPAAGAAAATPAPVTDGGSAAPVAAPAPAPAIDPSKFPGGIVPGKLPANRMWGKVKPRGR